MIERFWRWLVSSGAGYVFVFVVTFLLFEMVPLLPWYWFRVGCYLILGAFLLGCFLEHRNWQKLENAKRDQLDDRLILTQFATSFVRALLEQLKKNPVEDFFVEITAPDGFTLEHFGQAMRGLGFKTDNEGEPYWILNGGLLEIDISPTRQFSKENPRIGFWVRPLAKQQVRE